MRHRHQNVHVWTPDLCKIRPCDDAQKLQEVDKGFDTVADCIEHDNGYKDGGDRDISLLSSAGHWEEARCLCLLSYLLEDEEVYYKEEDEGS